MASKELVGIAQEIICVNTARGIDRQTMEHGDKRSLISPLGEWPCFLTVQFTGHNAQRNPEHTTKINNCREESLKKIGRKCVIGVQHNFYMLADCGRQPVAHKICRYREHMVVAVDQYSYLHFFGGNG